MEMLALHSRFIPLSALTGAIVLLLSGCIAHTVVDDIVDSFSCHGAECPVQPGVQVRMLPPRISDDSNEIAIPFLCKPFQAKERELRAMFLNVNTNEWRRGVMSAGLERDVQESLAPLTHEQLKASESHPDEPPHHCVADCGQSVWIDRADPIGRQQHLELFYSRDSVVSQLTHFNIPGAPISAPRLAANGHRAVLVVAGKLGIVEVPSGTTAVVPVYAKAFQDCSVP
jgi:hypothetical protein